MAFRRVKGDLERIFDKNLTDLVRGIRNNKENEAKYITQCIDEIKDELHQENIAIKANAVAKLTYLQMLGYDISWAAFNVIEVMSSTKFTFKRIGYLAASQCFHENIEVLMLTTNMIRKDLNSQNMYDTGTSMSGLACFVTTDLARDLANDVMTLLVSTKPYLRKKAVLLMYKIFLQFPEALRPAFPRLKEKLEDPDTGVQSAAVNVICELARKNPKNYLSLAPIFFKLMTSSTNNWMLIKIIKLFGVLTFIEPRLGRKLSQPLINIIRSTSAMSLLYECINTVIAVLISISTGMPNHTASIQLCVQKLRILIEDSDQNLKYLGLLAMSKILKTHPKSVQTHKDLILKCLDDKDESIRLRALDLLCGMVSKRNLMEIVKKLMVHMETAEGTNYRDELLCKVIHICSQNNYQYVINFEWYITILVELTRVEGTKHGSLIASQMLDVAIRVQAIRSFAASQMVVLLNNANLLIANTQRNSMYEVLFAAAWICGEFSNLILDPKSCLEAMLQSKVMLLPPHIQSIYIQNVLKLYTHIIIETEIENDSETVQTIGQYVVDKMLLFTQSADLEVQERACSVLHLIKQLMKLQVKGERVGDEMGALFLGDLNPVAQKAQKKVPIPEGLDLDEWINEPFTESSEEEFAYNSDIFIKKELQTEIRQNDFYKRYEPTEEELELRREARKQEQANNPHYLKVTPSAKNEDVFDNIPIAHIDLPIPLQIPGLITSDKYLQCYNDKKKNKWKKTKKTRKKHKKEKEVLSDTEDNISAIHQVTILQEEMPEGAKSTDDDNDRSSNDPHRALNIDLEEPLRDDEYLFVKPYDNSVSFNDNIKYKAEKKYEKERITSRKKEKGSKKISKKYKNKINMETIEKEEQRKTADKGNSSDVVDNKNDRNNSDDTDFWLLPDVLVKQPNANEVCNQKVSPSPSSLSKDSFEEKGEYSSSEKMRIKRYKMKKQRLKKSRKEKKKKERNDPNLSTQCKDCKNKSEYEETPGITTPSKEPGTDVANTPLMPSLPLELNYNKVLAEDDNIKLTYRTHILQNIRHELVVSVIFKNLSDYQLKDLEFNVMDTLNAKMICNSKERNLDGIKLPFQLLVGMANEGQFIFSVDNIVRPERLRGTFTYIVMTKDGSTHEKLEFKLHFPVSSYMIGTIFKRENFIELLNGRDLVAKESLKLTLSEEIEFLHILSMICFHCHFTVVEQVGSSASLYSCSIHEDHICLLIKQLNPKYLNIDGKCTNSQLLSSLLEEMKEVLHPSNRNTYNENNLCAGR